MLINKQLEYLINSEKIYVYIYEWINNFSYIKESQLKPEDKAYKIIETCFLNAGWNGDGILTEIWIPPFSLGQILNEPIDYGFNLIDVWKDGYILWHIKQKEDGLSFIGSLKQLEIPDYALKEIG